MLRSLRSPWTLLSNRHAIQPPPSPIPMYRLSALRYAAGNRLQQQVFQTAEARDFTIVVPTFARDEVLLETIQHHLNLDPVAAEIIIVDQTKVHHPAVQLQLSKLHERGRIQWVRLTRPSQPAAMNVGLSLARTEYVLFQDDDIIPSPNLIAALVKAIGELRQYGAATFIVGQVLHGAEEAVPVRWQERQFPLNSDRRYIVDDGGAGNLCVHRPTALQIGGFDENFVGNAYRADTDLLWRAIKKGHLVVFEPSASVRHLKWNTGGTRTFGHYTRNWKPHAAVCAYYFAFCWGCMPAGDPSPWLIPFKYMATRYHLRHPWYVPRSIVSHVTAFFWAAWLRSSGRQLIKRSTAGRYPVRGPQSSICNVR